MRALITGLLLVWTCLLALMAYDVHRVTIVLASPTSIAVDSKPLTHDEKVKALRRMLRDADDTMDIIASTPLPSTRTHPALR
jgi:hypothetical protein